MLIAHWQSPCWPLNVCFSAGICFIFNPLFTVMKLIKHDLYLQCKFCFEEMSSQSCFKGHITGMVCVSSQLLKNLVNLHIIYHFLMCLKRQNKRRDFSSYDDFHEIFICTHIKYKITSVYSTYLLMEETNHILYAFPCHNYQASLLLVLIIRIRVSNLNKPLNKSCKVYVNSFHYCYINLH